MHSKITLLCYVPTRHHVLFVLKYVFLAEFLVSVTSTNVLRCKYISVFVSGGLGRRLKRLPHA
jgi:hypothetical protein